LQLSEESYRWKYELGCSSGGLYPASNHQIIFAIRRDACESTSSVLHKPTSPKLSRTWPLGQ
jgi:hypothetical protein